MSSGYVRVGYDLADNLLKVLTASSLIYVYNVVVFDFSFLTMLPFGQCLSAPFGCHTLKDDFCSLNLLDIRSRKPIG